MPDNNKISVDIDIKIDGSSKIDQLNDSLSNLRSTVNSIVKPFGTMSASLGSLEKDLSKTVKALEDLTAQNKELVANTANTGNKVAELATNFVTIDTIVNIVTKSTKNLWLALTGGLSILMTFAPEIISMGRPLLGAKMPLAWLPKVLRPGTTL